MSLSADEAACSIYALTVTPENKAIAMKQLKDAKLEPVVFRTGDPTLAFAVSTKKVALEPLRYHRLIAEDSAGDVTDDASCNSETESVNNDSSDSQPTRFKSYKRSRVIELVSNIFVEHHIEGLTDQRFLNEDEVAEIIMPLLPDANLTTSILAEYMAKDGRWGTTRRKRMEYGRKHGVSIMW
ncbi:uncharacterized protein BYT42DRAFT_561308 [Radiomyces spectabilis]|uniref:uncharacterized protein n=1 Tax=Radiomyces spectabilis TaxID=64574 RepID=UPI0022204A15|nr:uncharacterized protein BYT42DRAFT_561308 [Radiomyces spectabilis]KAI8388805.1 hypothetical protein BYT42DRAFT_561308 [Radiomyces spectabilis]